MQHYRSHFRKNSLGESYSKEYSVGGKTSSLIQYQIYWITFSHIARGVKEFRGFSNKAIRMVGHRLSFRDNLLKLLFRSPFVEPICSYGNSYAPPPPQKKEKLERFLYSAYMGLHDQIQAIYCNLLSFDKHYTAMENPYEPP